MRILEFKISNYCSFYSEQSIDFDTEHNVYAIYGPNGAGKTNLFSALRSFCDLIKHSTAYSGREVSMKPFLLNEAGEKEPTNLSLSIMNSNGKIFSYGFSVLAGVVKDEFLTVSSSKEGAGKTTIFRRPSIAADRYEKYGFTRDLLNKTRDDALLLTKAYEDNNKIAKEFFDMLDQIDLRGSSLEAGNYETSHRIDEDAAFKEKVLSLLQAADLYIQDVVVKGRNLPNELYHNMDMPNNVVNSIFDALRYQVSTTHIVRDSKTGAAIQTRNFSLDGQESKGTQRIFALAAPIINTLENGGVLYIDEFEAYLHPNECEFLVDLFMRNNKKNAQLIINTHATQLMDNIGRDAVYFVGKDNSEQSIIKRMPKTVRPGEHSLEKKYRKGIFGAIPNIKESY